MAVRTGAATNVADEDDCHIAIVCLSFISCVPFDGGGVVVAVVDDDVDVVLMVVIFQRYVPFAVIAFICC